MTVKSNETREHAYEQRGLTRQTYAGSDLQVWQEPEHRWVAVMAMAGGGGDAFQHLEPIPVTSA